MRTAFSYALTLLGASVCSAAEVYPSKSVRVVVPFSPGGTVDLTGRLIGQQLSEQLGKPFVVDNRTGASGRIGNAIVAKATADGYTLMIMDTSTTIVPGLFKSLSFDVAKDFTPITEIMRAPEAFIVHPSVNVNTMKDFVAVAHASPGKMTYGSAGAGGAIHLSAELFKIAAKVDIAHVPYKGGGEAMAAVLAGQVQMLLTTIPTVLPFVRTGKVRALAVTTEDGKRSPVMPDVPSMEEAGVQGMTVYLWFGLVGPAGMPRRVVNRLHGEVRKAMEVRELRERFMAQGGELVGSAPNEFSVLINSELRRWAEVIKSAGIAPE